MQEETCDIGSRQGSGMPPPILLPRLKSGCLVCAAPPFKIVGRHQHQNTLRLARAVSSPSSYHNPFFAIYDGEKSLYFSGLFNLAYPN